MMKILIGLLVSTALSLSAFAEGNPKVAVSDLAYEEQVKDNIRVVDSKLDGDYSRVEGDYTYINQRELHKFVGDIKAGIKKSNLLDLIQGRPYTGDPEHDNIQDIIARIEQGDFSGADYVLFGRVSDIQFTNNVMNIQHTNTYSKVLNLTLVAEFSLIDTKTYEIKAAFTAKGQGKELKLVNKLDKQVTLDRANLVSTVSKDLGQDVVEKLVEQLTGDLPEDEYSPPVRNNVPADEPPTVIRRI